ncbi:hypothetical protein CVH10_16720 [Halomonas sp. ND22Bw]|uniref:hypothetical protein n=1 Tax=Halomonas sp. ND22Bw TaxID=2054178 RepID=UPI000D0B4E16|nr:hypothetical protein CVH10_16720 [Halomonas sp. ND22Bw]
MAKGFAGASVALGAETGLAFNENGLQLTGVDWAQREAEGATLKAFAGATLGLQTQCELRWKPPLDIIERLPKYAALDELGMLREPLDDWGELSKATLAAEALAGIGAEADFQIGLIDGKFVLTLKARLVLKGGIGGKFSVELDPDRLDPWMGMLHQALVDNDYEVVDWITPAAFDGFSKLFFMQTMLMVDVGMLALRGIDFVNDLYAGFTRSDRAGPIAHSLTRPLSRNQENERKAWVQQLPPEALGPLLHVLRADPGFFGYDVEDQSYDRGQAIDLQQIAISRCLGWIEEGYMSGLYPRSSAQTLFEKAISRMTQDGKRDESVSLGQAYCQSRFELDQFMGMDSDTGNANASDARGYYQEVSRRLGNNHDHKCEIVHPPAGTRAYYRGS